MATVIIQETDEDIRAVLTEALLMEGFDVYPVPASVQKIIELIDKVKPQVVVLDYKYNGENCINTCRSIKQKYPGLPVVALSCNSDINDRYLKNGFDSFIQKPFDLEVLYRTLNDAVIAN